jgi:hypothetical protein
MRPPTRMKSRTRPKNEEVGLGLIKSQLQLYRQSHALDYRDNLAHTVASWILVPRWRSLNSHYFSDRRDCA